MAEWLISLVGLVVVLKFAWDHLVMPLIDNVLQVRAFLRNENQSDDEPLADPIGFVHFGDPDDDDDDYEEYDDK